MFLHSTRSVVVWGNTVCCLLILATYYCYPRKTIKVWRHSLQTNVTAKRQQDSEANETHLEGYGGNVRLHAHHVAFGAGPKKTFSTNNPSFLTLLYKKTSSNQLSILTCFQAGYGAKKIVLPDIEKADREYFAVGPPKIMDQTLGPCTPPG